MNRSPITFPLFISFCFINFVSLSFSSSSSDLSPLNSDGLSLLALKAAVTADPTGALTTWSESDSTPCLWLGVTCDPVHRRVTSLSLPAKNLTGYIPSELGALASLRHLSLSANNFSRTIPPGLFDAATDLLSLDLSRNSLSGSIPAGITALRSLTRLDLSSNSLNGSLPPSLSDLPNLSGTLNLSFNRFSGEVPASYGLFQVMVSLDLRHNNLTGKIPQVGSLVNQGPTAFTGNPGLCGFPLENQCSAEPEARVFPDDSPREPRPQTGFSGKENGSVTVVSLISGVSVVITAVFVSVLVYRKKRRRMDEGKMGREKSKVRGAAEEGGQSGQFTALDEGFALGLEDLLRASAYVVGKGRSGIVYKVVVGRAGSGAAVAVRRLSENDSTWRLKEFESEVEAIGRVTHPNMVRLRAYYYANDEKLLVSDFVSNGSLYTALHHTGGLADTPPPLSWATRLKIAQCTARALTHIHECSPRKYVHGNLRSSKILLDCDLQPFISGFGLTRLVSASKKANQLMTSSKNLSLTSSSSSSSSIMFCVAPEARVPGNRFTQKCDVYSFGIVLLEILTGRAVDDGDGDKGLESLVRKVFREERPLSEIIDPVLLQQVHAKRQVVAAFHIALNCTELDPELRPKMRTVSDSLDRIKSQQ